MGIPASGVKNRAGGQSSDQASGAKIHLPNEVTTFFNGTTASEMHCLLLVMVAWERVRRGMEDLSARQSDPSPQDQPAPHPQGFGSIPSKNPGWRGSCSPSEEDEDDSPVAHTQVSGGSLNNQRGRQGDQNLLGCGSM